MWFKAVTILNVIVWGIIIKKWLTKDISKFNDNVKNNEMEFDNIVLDEEVEKKKPSISDIVAMSANKYKDED